MLEVAGAPHGWLLSASQRVLSLFPKHAFLLSLSCKWEGGKEMDEKWPLILRVSWQYCKSFHLSMKHPISVSPQPNIHIIISFFNSNQWFIPKRWVIWKQIYKYASCGIFSNNVCVLVGGEGVIKGWTEEQLNMSRAVHYNPETGTFKVERNGVYFLYCQVS